MPAAITAKSGQGTTWSCGAYGMMITDVSFSGASLGTIEASNMETPIGDPIPFIAEGNYDPGTIELTGELVGIPIMDGTVTSFSCAPGGLAAYTIAGECICTGWSATIPHRGKMTATMTFKISTLSDTGSGYYWYY